MVCLHAYACMLELSAPMQACTRAYAHGLRYVFVHLCIDRCIYVSTHLCVCVCVWACVYVWHGERAHVCVCVCVVRAPGESM